MPKPAIYREDCKHADKFYHAQGHRPADMLPKRARYGYTSLPVLACLIGCEWNDVTLGAVLALDPSCIRVTNGECTTDSIHKRITVYVDEGGRTITELEMEVQVRQFNPKIRDGLGFSQALRKMGAQL